MNRRALALLALAAVLPACESGSESVMLDAILDGVAPASPSTNQLPTFSGRAAPGALVEIFTNAAGSGVPASTGTASSSGTFDIVVAVPRPSQRTYYAFATPPRAPRSGPSNGLFYASRLGGFDAFVPLAVGASPLYVATADFNLDTRADLAVTCVSADTVVVLLGNGDGTFAAPPASYAVSGSPIGIATADFNGDLVPDLAVTSLANDAVAILLGDGTGAFGAATLFPVGDGPFALAAGDVDGGGTVDLVVANALGDSISVLLGAGDGSFAAAAGSPISLGDQPVGVILADLDGGRPDLLVACEISDEVRALLNTGGGSFAPAAGSPPAVDGPVGLAAADFNGDGRADVAVTSGILDQVFTFLGDGGGALQATLPPALAAGDFPVFVQAADLDGDGRTDLLAADAGSDTLTFFAGDGAGGFAAGTPIPAGTGPRGIVVADFNGDGAPDVAAVQSGANAVGIFLAK